MRPSADISIGQNFELMGRGDDAIAHLEKLMKERPEDVEVVMALGNVQRSRKKFAEAAETYSKAIELIGTARARPLDPLSSTAAPPMSARSSGTRREADLKKALELVPESLPAGRAQVMNYLAYSWVDQNMNIDEAFKMLTRAVELAPRDGMIIDSLGWAYYRMGRYEDAVRELEKAVELKAGRSGHQRPPGRRLLEGRPQARGEVPVGPRQGLESGARGAGEDPQEDRQRPGRGSEARRRRERARSPAGGAEAERRVGHALSASWPGSSRPFSFETSLHCHSGAGSVEPGIHKHDG